MVQRKEESPPPPWLAVQFGTGLVLSVAMAYLGGAMLPMLAATSAALASGVLARFARPDNAFRALAAVLVIQLLLLGAAGLWRPALDTAGLAQAKPALFASGDTVYAPEADLDGPAAYLVRRRFGVTVAPLSEAEEAIDGGRAIGLHGGGAALPWTLDPDAGTISRHE